MPICQYLTADGPRLGLVDELELFELAGNVFEEYARGPRIGFVADATLTAPVAPSKIICVGRNYAEHAAEMGNEVPEDPLLFFKPPSSVIGPGDAIRLLPEMGRVEHEAELGVIIKRRGRNIPEDDALDYVLGYTCANDITDRDYQKRDNQWARAKGFDTFCPVGPWIALPGELDAHDATIRCSVNGEARQEGSTSQMIRGVAALIAHISGIMTLEPGDLILTGTPAGVGPIEAEDEITVAIDGIGELVNSVTMG